MLLRPSSDEDSGEMGQIEFLDAGAGPQQGPQTVEIVLGCLFREPSVDLIVDMTVGDTQ
jgi:hypothetical protein